ncbi:Sodium/hydrogen exchanger family-domain-containing protein [Kockovaella imperatae]|uniref:Sodium/hydrogen exchanger family-domain-containing protein n=1 Tax=Kockovaella imperatae TaxID=4999 RepID=A0A1Y1UI58_9TREE|nr:Sodium/hydrogen exchanger family-domain-containing protein [Kockovaella imperatae]ORX37176.1 Sodium/hydrogen exchanger family-domain-containing protein [Kockovaella imperatae]
MAFRPFEVNVAHLAYTILGAFVVIFGMFSLVIKEKAYIGEAPIATIVGIIMGPYVTGLFDPRSWGGANAEVKDEITLEVTRVIIAVSVFSVGVELPKAYMRRHWRTLFFLLFPCMLWGWMISGLLMWALIPGINFLSALVIAAAVTPTDPILAQSVIGGKFADKHVPAHVRHMLSAESGSNDGAAFPFLGIALYLTLDASPGHAVGHWFYYTIAYEVILGIILGALLGWVARKVMKFSEAKKLIDRQSFVAQYVSLAILSIGFTSLLGSDDLLSAFACGCAFAWDGFFNKATEDAEFSNVIDLLFNCAAFIYIGAIIPFDSFNDPRLTIAWWRLVVLAICILLVRRLPVIMALYKWIPDIKTFREALFVGWFGPMGVGAVFISTLAKTSLPEGDVEKDTAQVDLLRDLITPVTLFLVLSSVVTHGLSIPFFSLGRRVHSITYTWSRNPSMDTRRDNEPAWTTHARRIVPGQEVRINRDDDAEEGDLGVRSEKQPTSRDMVNRETSNGEESGGSSDSRTLAQGEDIEMRSRHSSRSQEDRSQEERSQEARSDDGASQEETRSEEARGAQDYEEEEAGERTPPLAEFREGNNLVVERKGGEGEEVEVEVIHNAFGDHPTKKTTFNHPRRLHSHEIQHLATNFGHALEKKLSSALGGGDSGEHNHQAHTRDRNESRDEEPPNEGPSRLPGRSHELYAAEPTADEGDEEWPDSDEDRGESSRSSRKQQKSSAPPKPKIKLPGQKKGVMGWFSKRDRSPSPSAVEEGRASMDPGLLSPPRSRAMSPRQSGEGIPLTRTASLQRNTAIRFAEDSQPSSDSAPGPGNYGNTAPGFKRNPALAMFRTTSIQEGNDDDSASVSFKEPSRRR